VDASIACEKLVPETTPIDSATNSFAKRNMVGNYLSIGENSFTVE